MTVPTPYLSPIAGLFNSLVAWLNRQLTDRALLLEAEIAVANAETKQLNGDQS